MMAATSAYLNRLPMSLDYGLALERSRHQDHRREARSWVAPPPLEPTRRMSRWELETQLRIARLDKRAAWLDMRIICQLNGIYGDKTSLINLRRSCSKGTVEYRTDYQPKRDKLADALVRWVRARDRIVALKAMLAEHAPALAAAE